MSAFWQIQGEAGKDLDATTRDLDAVGAQNPQLVFKSLGVDTLTYSVLLSGLAPTSELLPEEGQKVTLFRNGSRFFLGHCSRVRQRGYLVDVTISGAGWWLERLNLTSLQTDSASVSAERLSYVFPTQSLTTSVNDLLTRAIALGAPIAIGSLATTFSCPRITLSQMTLAAALAELIRLTPDVSGWWDYSGTTPTFNTSRRSSATARTLAAEDLLPNGLDCYPLTEMKAEFVRVPYVARAADGQRIFKEQLSGDAGTAQSGSTSTTLKLRSGASVSDDAYNGLTVQITSGTGSGQSKTITDYVGSTKVATVNSAWTTTPNNTSVYKVGAGLPTGAGTTQMLVVSGEELDTFLPNELFDSVALQTSPADEANPYSGMESFILAAEPFIASVYAEYGDPNNGVSVGFNYYDGISSSPTLHSVSFPAPKFTDPKTGAVITKTGKHIVIVGDVPDWLVDDLSMQQANLACTWASQIVDSSPNAPTTDWFQAMLPHSTRPDLASGKWASAGATTYRHWIVLDVNIPVVLIDTAYSSLTTVYRPADYDFLSPPAGFAAGMQESQGWTPYAGSLAFEEAEAGGTRYRGCKVHVTGALPAFATMGALVESETLFLDSGRTTLGLGAPARLDYRTFVDRIRRTAQDNIVYV